MSIPVQLKLFGEPSPKYNESPRSGNCQDQILSAAGAYFLFSHGKPQNNLLNDLVGILRGPRLFSNGPLFKDWISGDGSQAISTWEFDYNVRVQSERQGSEIVVADRSHIVDVYLPHPDFWQEPGVRLLLKQGQSPNELAALCPEPSDLEDGEW